MSINLDDQRGFLDPMCILGANFTSIHLAQLTENHAIVIEPVRVACRLNM